MFGSNGGRIWVPLAVVAVHGALLVSGAGTAESITPPEMPALVVSLETEAPVSVPTPRPPLPVQRPKPPTVDMPPIAPVPAAEAPVIAAPPSPSPPPPAAESAAPVPVEPEPVQPPSVDKAHGSQPPVVYPSMSQKLNETGVVTLRLHVQADGSIDQALVTRSSGFPRLDRAAVTAAMRWRLNPARRGGVPIDMWYTWPVTFELN